MIETPTRLAPLLLLLLACDSTPIAQSPSAVDAPPVPAAEPSASQERAQPPEANVLEPGKAPTPFSADQIRDGNPPGSVKEYRMVQGGRVMLQRIEFVETRDPATAAFRVTTLDEAGAELGTTDSPAMQWTDLQRHASYDASRTFIGRDRITVAAGEFDCWSYSVDQEGGAIASIWFAVDLPGPPVLMETIRPDEETTRMELVAYSGTPSDE